MKTLLVTTCLLFSVAFGAFAQGKAAFASNGATTGNGLITDQNSVLLGQGFPSGTTKWTAELVGGLSSSQGTWTTLATATQWFQSVAGQVLGGQFTVSGGANQTLFYAVRAWDTTTGASYDVATVRGQSSGTATITMTEATNNLLTPPNANTWQSFQLSATVVPEPSTIVLGLMGGLGLLLRRRK